jgi:hypothetical protein
LDITGSKKKAEELHNEKLHNLYFFKNIIRMVISLMMLLPGHISRRAQQLIQNSGRKNLKEREKSGRASVNGRRM